jgi:hypothetical protein
MHADAEQTHIGWRAMFGQTHRPRARRERHCRDVCVCTEANTLFPWVGWLRLHPLIELCERRTTLSLRLCGTLRLVVSLPPHTELLAVV